MPSKNFLAKFWHHPQGTSNPTEGAKHTEVPMNKLEVKPAESPYGPQGDLLSCEDIYLASGIVSPRSRYGINKIVEMLNSRHIRELSKDVKRASVLMALDAAGSTVDEVLQDASRRQHALNSYEAGQRKQFDEFEARKNRENAQIQAELERVTAHYAERIKHNQELVAHEKEALRSWQTMKEQESQRIAEAVALCGKQPATESPADPLPQLPAQRAAAGTP